MRLGPSPERGSCERAEGLRSKTRASRAWCVVQGAHGGPPLLHVAIGTGHPGGGIYPMGLCRESAEDVEPPKSFC
jgi:hypothetical protein